MLVVTAVRDFKHWATSVEYLQRLYLETEVQSLAQANSVSSCLSGCRWPSDHCNTVDVLSTFLRTYADLMWSSETSFINSALI